MLKLALLKTKLFDCHTYWLVKLTPINKRPRGHRCFFKKKVFPTCQSSGCLWFNRRCLCRYGADSDCIEVHVNRTL